jgi:hypothetical protein
MFFFIPVTSIQGRFHLSPFFCHTKTMLVAVYYFLTAHALIISPMTARKIPKRGDFALSSSIPVPWMGADVGGTGISLDASSRLRR